MDDTKYSLLMMETQEGEEAHLDLPEDDPHVIARLLQFIYAGYYDADEAPAGLHLPEETEKTLPTGALAAQGQVQPPKLTCLQWLEFHALMNTYGDKYSIANLRAYVGVHFASVELDDLSTTELESVIKMVVESTLIKDTLVRNHLYHFCFKPSSHINAESCQLLHTGDPVLWELGRKLVQEREECWSLLVRTVETTHCLKCGTHYGLKIYRTSNIDARRYYKKCDQCSAKSYIDPERR